MVILLSSILLSILLPDIPSLAGGLSSAVDTVLVFPGMLQKEQLAAGNPLATYAAMVDLEEEYLGSPAFARIYPEVKANFEQFLGMPNSGVRAMSLPAFRRTTYDEDVSVLDGYMPRSALAEISDRAESTQIVVWGEEHHLPQTRSLYERLVESLWTKGYRYLAAETFTDSFASDQKRRPDYDSGYYLRDPVFAHAVRIAQDVGYELVAYDTNARGESGDLSFRDRTQAENIFDRVFANDPDAKILVLAGRGHASEQRTSDGWTPMAFVLKQLTGVDPLTVYAPTMSERLSPEEEHPIFRHVVSRGLIEEPTIFVRMDTQEMFGTASFDAYVFWPRTSLHEGRPTWMATTLGRTSTGIPLDLLSEELQLIQAFYPGDSFSQIPVDQIVFDGAADPPNLVLPAGTFRIRSIDREGRETGSTLLDVR